MNTDNKIHPKFTAIILAAGNSIRMGRSKPFLIWKGKETFLEKLVCEYQKFGCKEIIIVFNENVRKEFYLLKFAISEYIRIVINPTPEMGRYSSIKLGLQAIGDKSAFCFVQNIDNPFIDSEVLTDIAAKCYDDKCTIPEFKGRRGHPVLVPPEIIRNMVNDHDPQSNFRQILHLYPNQIIPVLSEKILFNINTNEDYKKYFPLF